MEQQHQLVCGSDSLQECVTGAKYVQVNQLYPTHNEISVVSGGGSGSHASQSVLPFVFRMAAGCVCVCARTCVCETTRTNLNRSVNIVVFLFAAGNPVLSNLPLEAVEPINSVPVLLAPCSWPRMN